MDDKSMIGWLKALWGNFHFLITQQREQPQSRAALAANQLDESYERLKAALEDKSLRKDLDVLKATNLVWSAFCVWIWCGQCH